MLDAIFRHNNATTKYNICYSFDCNEISSSSLLISLASLFFRHHFNTAYKMPYKEYKPLQSYVGETGENCIITCTLHLV
jgi:hypothetical protein